tara:strand:- start:1461 stop:1811 length:351 start_codon:yes stop_codon:yes gene_type:complete
MVEKKPKITVRKYFPPPAVIGTLIEYIDVNKDKTLRKSVTTFFHKKMIKWVSEYPEFSHLKKYLKIIKSHEGFELMYKVIRSFVKAYNINWYDLKDNYNIFKDFLKFKFGEYLSKL